MPTADFDDRLRSVRETRARLPELVRNRHVARRRRSAAAHTGRLVLVEVDDPARGRLDAAGDAHALVDRARLLERVVEALDVPGVDGVIATADVLDDLLLLEALEDRIAIGTMNSGGLWGTEFAADDRFTGFDPDVLAASHLEGGKIRLHLDPRDRATARTLEAAGEAVTGLASHGLLALLEAAWVSSVAEGQDLDTSPEALARAVAIASGLGGRSAYSWLVLPEAAGLSDVLPATTLPALVRLDEAVSAGTQADLPVSSVEQPGVRGVVIPVGLLAGAKDVQRVVGHVVDLVRRAAERDVGGPN